MELKVASSEIKDTYLHDCKIQNHTSTTMPMLNNQFRRIWCPMVESHKTCKPMRVPGLSACAKL